MNNLGGILQMKRIYLDHAATTPLHPDVLETMLPYLQGSFGNPSSLHHYGRAARSQVNEARKRMAQYLGCHDHELIFTAGGTESNNMALFGAVRGAADRPHNSGHIITSQIEHHSVLYACEQLEQAGYEVTYISADPMGRVHLEEIQAALKPETIIVSIMYANNEVGTIQPITEIGRVLRDRGILFHVDAVQALGNIDFTISDLPVDMMSFSAHKINGPQGIGALYMSNRVRDWLPMIVGGAQERNRRAGTEYVSGIIGFADALKIVKKDGIKKQPFTQTLRIEMIKMLQSELGSSGFVVNGHPTEQLSNILNVSFPGVDTETMLMNLDLEGIAVASGSACTSGSHKVSHVLQAMQLPEDITRSAVRFSFGLGNTIEEIAIVTEKIGSIVRRIRSRQSGH